MAPTSRAIMGHWKQRLTTAGRLYLLTAGAVSTATLLWLASPLPLLVAKPLVWNDAPAAAAAIVCLGSGVDDGLPSSTGWVRIRTSARLFHAGFAPVVIFSGGTVHESAGRSIAEVYAEAARRLGVPESAVLVEPLAKNTADHPRQLLGMDLVKTRGGTAAPLLVVTSAYHGRRVGLCFRKAGFTQTRIITNYDPAPHPSEDDDLEPSSFRRHFVGRLYATLAALQEWAALLSYRAKGWV
jgi:uncharacterized SAM-binding protein YcdF (DUF218 family)